MNSHEINDSYEVNKLRDFKENFVIVRSSLSIDIEIRSFLKHNIHKRFLSFNKTITYDIFHEIFCCFQITKINVNFFSFIFISSKKTLSECLKDLSNHQKKSMKTHSF